MAWCDLEDKDDELEVEAKIGGGSGTFIGDGQAGGVELDILANALPRPPEVLGSDGADLGHMCAGDLPRPPEAASDADGSVDLAVLGAGGVLGGSQGPLARAPKKQRRQRKGKTHPHPDQPQGAGDGSGGRDDAHKAKGACAGCAASFGRYWSVVSRVVFRGWGGPDAPTAIARHLEAKGMAPLPAVISFFKEIRAASNEDDWCAQFEVKDNGLVSLTRIAREHAEALGTEGIAQVALLEGDIHAVVEQCLQVPLVKQWLQRPL